MPGSVRASSYRAGKGTVSRTAILILAECRTRDRNRNLYRISSLFGDSDSEPDTDPIGSIITNAARCR